MAFGSGPITGEAIRRGMTADQIAATGHEEGLREQADVDEQEFKELEQAKYYGEPAAPPAQPASTGIVARLRAIFRSGR
jgi:hypothetical protein